MQGRQAICSSVDEWLTVNSSVGVVFKSYIYPCFGLQCTHILAYL